MGAADELTKGSSRLVVRAERGRARALDGCSAGGPPDAGLPVLALFKLILNFIHVNNGGLVVMDLI